MLFSLMVSSSPCGRATSGSAVPELVVAGTGVVVRFIGHPSLWGRLCGGATPGAGVSRRQTNYAPKSGSAKQKDVDDDQLGGIGRAHHVRGASPRSLPAVSFSGLDGVKSHLTRAG